MAGTKRMRAMAVAVALATTMLAGPAMAITTVRTTTPLGGPIRWTGVWRIRLAGGFTLLGPNGVTTIRTVGVYGKAGWGTFRSTAR